MILQDILELSLVRSCKFIELLTLGSTRVWLLRLTNNHFQSLPSKVLRKFFILETIVMNALLTGRMAVRRKNGRLLTPHSAVYHELPKSGPPLVIWHLFWSSLIQLSLPFLCSAAVKGTAFDSWPWVGVALWPGVLWLARLNLSLRGLWLVESELHVKYSQTTYTVVLLDCSWLTLQFFSHRNRPQIRLIRISTPVTPDDRARNSVRHVNFQKVKASDR